MLIIKVREGKVVSIKEKIERFVYHSIKIIYIFLMMWTFLGAVRSPNLEINNVSGISIGVILIAFFIYIIIRINKIKTIIHWIIHKCSSVKVVICWTILVFVLQFSFVMFTHPKIGFDVGVVHRAILGNIDISYFSHCTNNLPILLVQHFIYTIFHNEGWLLLDVITLFLVDISAVLNVCTLALVNKKYVVRGVYVHLIWLALFPMIIVPYTDTWVLPLVSLTILMWALMVKKNINYVVKILCAVIMSSAIVGAYFIKPSAVITAIAIALVELIRVGFRGEIGKDTVKNLGIIACLCVSFIGFFFMAKSTINNQKYVALEKDKAMPPIHFVAIGLIGNGGYNPQDASDMYRAKDTNEIKEISKRKIKERLEQKGPLGYIRFLLHKQNMNTADGTFGWNAEGAFLDQQMPTKGVEKRIAEYIYPNGRRLHDFSFVAQVWWIVWLFILLFGCTSKNDRITWMTRLAIIGGMVFLLLFEGGRSRYLIQFLPSFLILASIQIETAKFKIKNLLQDVI